MNRFDAVTMAPSQTLADTIASSRGFWMSPKNHCCVGASKSQTYALQSDPPQIKTFVPCYGFELIFLMESVQGGPTGFYTTGSLKQHTKYFNIQSKIQLDHPVLYLILGKRLSSPYIRPCSKLILEESGACRSP